MGARAVVQFRYNRRGWAPEYDPKRDGFAVDSFDPVAAEGARYDYSPAVYLHWHGPYVAAMIEETFEMMAAEADRGIDMYAARFIGVAHSHVEPPLSLRVTAVDGRIDAGDFDEDCGLFLVDITERLVMVYGHHPDNNGESGFHNATVAHWQNLADMLPAQRPLLGTD